MWKQSSYVGSAIDFAPIRPDDDHLHPVSSNAHYTNIETYLCGFNIPQEDINCNIYLLWHHVLKTMSMHVFVYRGARMLPHQLAADYFVEHQYLPMGDSDRDFRFTMGSCAVRFQIVKPLDEMLIQVDDPQRQFALACATAPHCRR